MFLPESHEFIKNVEGLIVGALTLIKFHNHFLTLTSLTILFFLRPTGRRGQLVDYDHGDSRPAVDPMRDL